MCALKSQMLLVTSNISGCVCVIFNGNQTKHAHNIISAISNGNRTEWSTIQGVIGTRSADLKLRA